MKKRKVILLFSDLEGTILRESDGNFDPETMYGFLSQLHKLQLLTGADVHMHLVSPVFQKQMQEVTDLRRSQVGTWDRSERIRTYNFPEGRVTDHRIKLTLYKLDQIMNGDLNELIDSLIAADQTAKLAQVNEEE